MRRRVVSAVAVGIVAAVIAMLGFAGGAGRQARPAPLRQRGTGRGRRTHQSRQAPAQSVLASALSTSPRQS